MPRTRDKKSKSTLGVCLALVTLFATPTLASEAWQWASRLETEAEQCQMLLVLCQEATRALDNAELTPPSLDVLASKNAIKADLRVRDAVSAARVFLDKNDGRRLPCFDDPECDFLDAYLRQRYACPLRERDRRRLSEATRVARGRSGSLVGCMAEVLPDTAPRMPLAGACNGCGACCRVLTLPQSPEEIRNIAAVTRVLGIPSDHQFAADHWRSLTREEAMRRNPFYTSRLPPDAHLYTCDRLGDDGRCMAYEERPLVCRGYPWYETAPRNIPLADAECGYLVDLTLKMTK